MSMSPVSPFPKHDKKIKDENFPKYISIMSFQRVICSKITYMVSLQTLFSLVHLPLKQENYMNKSIPTNKKLFYDLRNCVCFLVGFFFSWDGGWWYLTGEISNSRKLYFRFQNRQHYAVVKSTPASSYSKTFFLLHFFLLLHPRKTQAFVLLRCLYNIQRCKGKRVGKKQSFGLKMLL